MHEKNKQIIKIILALITILINVFIIGKIKINSNTLVSIKTNKDNLHFLKVMSGSKVYEKIENNGESKEKILQEEKNNKEIFSTFFHEKDKIDLNTKDNAKPDNVEDIKVKVLEDNFIVNFENPKDNGTKYKYTIEKDKDEEEIEIYEESGIKGYCYKIDNLKQTKLDDRINKLNNDAIVTENIDWNKDYYLHIKTVDNENNYSEEKTFKVCLPSEGVSIKYIDINSGDEIEKQENINGNINEEYDAENLKKDIEGYKCISNLGDLQGKLSKNKINIIYQYARCAVINVEYIEKESGNKIFNASKIEGYEGKNIEIKAKHIDGYKYLEGQQNGKMAAGVTNINMYYEKINETGNIENTEVKRDKYTNESKEQIDKNQNIDINVNTNINKRSINIRYVDIDTNEILYNDKIEIEEEKSIKIRLKNIEGYNIMKDNRNKMSKEVEKEDNDKDKEKIESEYEIIMNCDDSDYIVFYKKK